MTNRTFHLRAKTSNRRFYDHYDWDLGKHMLTDELNLAASFDTEEAAKAFRDTLPHGTVNFKVVYVRHATITQEEVAAKVAARRADRKRNG